MDRNEVSRRQERPRIRPVPRLHLLRRQRVRRHGADDLLRLGREDDRGDGRVLNGLGRGLRLSRLHRRSDVARIYPGFVVVAIGTLLLVALPPSSAMLAAAATMVIGFSLAWAQRGGRGGAMPAQATVELGPDAGP